MILNLFYLRYIMKMFSNICVAMVVVVLAVQLTGTFSMLIAHKIRSIYLIFRATNQPRPGDGEWAKAHLPPLRLHQPQIGPYEAPH